MKLLCITALSSHPIFDTTLSLYQCLAKYNGIQLFHTSPLGIAADGAVTAFPVSPFSEREKFYQLEAVPAAPFELTHFDLVFCRTDKPYPPGYLNLLEQFESTVRFVNRPSGIRRHSETPFARTVAEPFLPPHIETTSIDEAITFLRQHNTIVAKRAASYGGKGVYRIRMSEQGFLLDNIYSGEKLFAELEELFSFLFLLDSNPWQFVKFLTTAASGDKRVLVVDGEILGGYIRKSDSSWVHNITAGAIAYPATVSEKEVSVIAATAPQYLSLGIRTLGYDFLMGEAGEWCLSEINAGNIGGYDRLEKLSGKPVIEQLIARLICGTSSSC